jgi:superfamily II DNA or RNA helicase
VVVDEAHKLKNDRTMLSQAFKQVRTRRRLALTGTPVQNNLVEYFMMVDWVRPNSLGTRKEFDTNFADAIARGQHTDSTPAEWSTMRKRAYILHSKLSALVHRKGCARARGARLSCARVCARVWRLRARLAAACVSGCCVCVRLCAGCCV